MGLVVNTNIASIIAQNNLAENNADSAIALERLSSGLRINSARDDAAGLAISTGFTAQIEGLDVGVRNANDGVSLTQIAEGALGGQVDSLLRIRELALQSANGSNSDSDRAALNAEVQELIEEIARVSEQTTFNGIPLLDGSFDEITFQIGANLGETVTVDIAGSTIDQLGSAPTVGLTSVPAPGALQAGDLVINGVAIAASTGASDTTSFANQDESAIALAAAINLSSELSGVTADVNETRVTGNDFTSTDQNGSFFLNGVEIQIATDADISPEANLTAVAAAINEASGQTGVEALFDGNPNIGITLLAEDGRNITLENGPVATPPAVPLLTENIGLASAGPNPGDTTNFVGNFTLISVDGSPITLTSDTGNIDNAGLEISTFNGGSAGAAGNNVGGVPLETGDLVINNVAVGPTLNSFDTASSDLNDASGISVAAAINAVSEVTGVTAIVNPTVVNSGPITASGPAAGSININGVDVTFAFTSSDSVSDRLNGIISAVNSVAGLTGVTAEPLDGDQLTLVAEDGRNIIITDGAGVNTDNDTLGFGIGDTAEASLVSSLDPSVVNIDLGNFDAFNIDVNGAGPVTVTLTDPANADGLITSNDELVDSINAGLAAAGVTDAQAVINISGQVSIQTLATGSDTTLAITAAAANDVSAILALDGSAASITGATPAAIFPIDVTTNNQFDIAVDGGTPVTITLVGGDATPTSLDSISELVDAINAGITASALDGLAVASLDTSGTLVTLSTTSTNGLTSDITATDGTFLVGTIGFTSGATVTGTSTTQGAEVLNNNFSSVSLEAGSSFELTTTTGNIANAGFEVGFFGGAVTGEFVENLDISTVEGALEAIEAVDNALTAINLQRANLGAIQNRFEATIINQNIAIENLSAANSQILDADFAAETAELSRTQVLVSAGISVLAQANAAPEGVLQLLA